MSELIREPKPSEEAYRAFKKAALAFGSLTPRQAIETAYEHDVAPLLARIAELETENKRLSLAVGASANEIGRLRGEIDRLRTDNGQLHADLFGTQEGALLQDLRAEIERLTKERDEARERIAEIEKEQDEVIEHAYNDGYGDGKIRAARLCRGFLVGDPANGVPLRNPMPHEIEAHIRKHLMPADMKSAEARAELLERRIAELERKCSARRAHTFDDVIDVSKQLLKRSSYYQEYCLDDAALLEEASQMLDEMAADWSEERERVNTFLVRAESAERQNAALVEVLRIAHSYIDTHGRIAGDLTPLAFETLHKLQSAALAQLDAPAEDRGSFARELSSRLVGHVEEPQAAKPTVVLESELIEECAESHKEMNNLGWEIERMKATLAEAVEIMRPFDFVFTDKSWKNEDIISLTHCGEAVYARTVSDFRAVHAFVEKHDKGRVPQPTEPPVTAEEVDDAINLYEPIIIDETQKLAMRAVLEAFVKNRSGKQ